MFGGVDCCLFLDDFLILSFLMFWISGFCDSVTNDATDFLRMANTQ